jgi:hypothetical protein
VQKIVQPIDRPLLILWFWFENLINLSNSVNSVIDELVDVVEGEDWVGVGLELLSNWSKITDSLHAGVEELFPKHNTTTKLINKLI